MWLGMGPSSSMTCAMWSTGETRHNILHFSPAKICSFLKLWNYTFTLCVQDVCVHNKKNLPILIYLEQTLNQTHYYIITIIPPFPWFLRAKTSIICTWAYAHSKTENSRQRFVILEVLLVCGAREWTLTFVSVVVLSRVRFKQIVTSCQFKCLHVRDRELAIEMLRSMRGGPWTVHTANNYCVFLEQRKSGLTLHNPGLTGKT